MRKILLILALVVIPVSLMAGDDAIAKKYFEVTGRHNDFMQRVFNFVILVGLLWYLLANPIKNFLKGREESIAGDLKEIEAKREAAKDAKITAEKALEDAKAKAVEIVEDAKKEAELLKSNILKHAEDELKMLEKVNNEKIDIERRRAIREATSKVLSDGISSDDIPLDSQKIIDIVTKEVA